MSYTPPQEILERYADVLVSYGLGQGRGVQAGEVVGLRIAEDAKPLLLEIAKAVWRAGGHLLTEFVPADDGHWNMGRAFYELASEEQLAYFPDAWVKTWFASIDHYLMVRATRDPQALAGVAPEKVMAHQKAWGPQLKHRFDKVNAGALSWSLAEYGTAALAAEAGMSLEEYWNQIISACYLDEPDPVARLRETGARIHATVDWLNGLDIDRLHVEAPDTDLWLTLGEGRRWIGGDTENIPSFEIFTSPDWRGTEGHISFSEPLYRNGAIMEGIRLRFEAGRVVEASATRGDAQIKALVAADAGAAQIGEYSLTDGRVSRITRFMATTLYDENRGGPAGNTHLAVGSAYRDTYTGDVANTTDEQFAALGFNESSIHVDIISTSDRTVTATLRDGSEQVIYAGGQFQND
ncbi:MAG TPA: aminopeptidase [Solirubrobacteraceae bacterium]|nr:aminopeptidase [Solirubrobacteraceae bacterium]